MLFIRHPLPGERVAAGVTDGEEDARFLDALRIAYVACDPAGRRRQAHA
ncbi:hypothetical protein AB0I77_00190 [Streptomyces sp. NPDC050619]